MMTKEEVELSRLLLQEGVVTQDGLNYAKQYCEDRNISFEQALMDLELCEKDDIPAVRARNSSRHSSTGERKLVFHFRKRGVQEGAMTVVYSRQKDLFAVARCNPRDNFCRKAGTRIASNRLKHPFATKQNYATTQRSALSRKGTGTFQSRTFSGKMLGLSEDPSFREVALVAYLLASTLAFYCNDEILKSYLSQNHPQIDASLEARFDAAWTELISNDEPLVYNHA